MLASETNSRRQMFFKLQVVMNFLYTDLPMSAVLRLDPYTNPKVMSSDGMDVNNNRTSNDVRDYEQSQKYEEPQLDWVTGGLSKSEWTSELLFRKSEVGKEGGVEVAAEATSELCLIDSGDSDSESELLANQNIRVTVVKDGSSKREARNQQKSFRWEDIDGHRVVRSQYLSTEHNVAGFRVMCYENDRPNL